MLLSQVPRDVTALKNAPHAAVDHIQLLST